MFSYFTILLLFSKETLKLSPAGETTETLVQNIKGYKLVVKDKYFIRFIGAMATGMIAPLMMWTLLAVYTKTNFSLSEAHYAWLPITNALMCVFLQYFITRITRRYHPKSMIALGMALYALGTGSVALMSSLFGFWLSMILLTFGELILVPTGTAFAANRAPSKLRGRYMSFYWLTWGIVRACAPLVGGILNDAISPRAIWYGGLIIGIFSSIMLLIDASKGDIPAHPMEI
jgi:MFS family permease